MTFTKTMRKEIVYICYSGSFMFLSVVLYLFIYIHVLSNMVNIYSQCTLCCCYVIVTMV